MEQADDGDETAAIDGLVSSWAENISAILLDSDYRHKDTDWVFDVPWVFDARYGAQYKSLS